jgi:hypothetical protein
VSHWTSGLPELDLEPFDPTPLWNAAEAMQAEQPAAEERRRRRLSLIGVGILAVATAVAGVLLLLA